MITAMTTDSKRTLTKRTAPLVALTPAQKLRDKILDVYSGDEEESSLVVDKTAAKEGGLGDVPRFVSEYLLAAMMARSRANKPNKMVQIEKVREQLKKGLVDALLSEELVNIAIADRLAGIIPTSGWLLPKITNEGLVQDVRLPFDWPWSKRPWPA